MQFSDAARSQYHGHDKGHRDTNEQTPKTLHETEETTWKCVTLHDKERCEDRLQCGLKQCGA